MSLGDFMNDSAYGGSWADDVEDDIMTGTQALPMPERRAYGGSSGYGNSGGYNSYGGGGGDRYERNYAPRNLGPQEIPDKPPYTAHLGNLSYDVTAETVTEFFQPNEIVSVRIIEDRENMRPKGFAYAEFKTPEGLKAALELDSTNFQGRSIRVKIADPPRDRPEGHSSGRDLDWTRKGPLADLPGSGNRGNREFNNNREFSERRAPREPTEDRGIRELGTWERKGPLSPVAREDPAREGSRPPFNNNNSGERSESLRGNNRREGASWGEGGRQQGEQGEGTRPPRPERVPTAAERDNQWRSNMRPDGAAEAPASPATAAPTRPTLKLQKRTAVETSEIAPSPVVGNSKANPFGAARPIDTTAREREVEERRQKEKKEAEEKAKEAKEAKEAQEAADKAAAEKAAAEKAAAEAKAAAEKAAEPSSIVTADKSYAKANTSSTGPADIKSSGPRPREQQPREQKPSRAAESGNWRSSGARGGGPTGLRRGDVRGPRGGRQDGGGGGGRGGRGDYRHGGNRGENHRDIREQHSVPSTPVTASAPEAGSPAPTTGADAPAAGDAPAAAAPVEDDGWTTVSVPRGKRNGRAVA
ncbi:hypothetical protein BROUX41_005131 [Berkeleyomyces rouxiae]